MRDEETKRRVLDKYGQRMLVLTVHECKGLEFQVRGLYDKTHAEAGLDVKGRGTCAVMKKEASVGARTWRPR